MYIHDYDNWWEFRYEASRLINLLAEVRTRQGNLLGRLSELGFARQNNTALEALSLDIIKSSEIEGEALSMEHVRSSLANRLGIDAPGIVPSTRYVDGIVDMMMDATHNYDAPITDNRLFGWHNVLFPTGRSGLYDIEVAKYRSGDMQVVSGAMGRERVHYKAPEAVRVAEEMARFCQWVNDNAGIDGVLKAAIAHLWFVSIHPFDDGNGRIARAVTEMLLARSERSALRFYSMSNMMCMHRKDYYAVLEKTQHGDGDITDWLEWFLKNMLEAVHQTEQTLASVISKNQFWENNKDVEFNERQRKIVNLLLDGFEGNMNTGRWSRICKCSRDTALKDAADLIGKGVMKRGEGGGRSTVYVLA